MGRKNKTACVYMLRNNTNGLVYIGETSNYTDRMSHYKNIVRKIDMGQITPRPVEQAIYDDGWDNFTHTILLEGSLVENTKDRLVAEAKFISAYKATDPKYGYNVLDKRRNLAHAGNKGFKHSTGTKILKSNPIISYNIETGEMFIWLGSKRFADELGVDRAQVARSVHNGKAIHGYYVFPLDKEERKKAADGIIERKMNTHSRNNTAFRTLAVYTEAYRKVDKFAKRWGS